MSTRPALGKKSCTPVRPPKSQPSMPPLLLFPVAALVTPSVAAACTAAPKGLANVRAVSRAGSAPPISVVSVGLIDKAAPVPHQQTQRAGYIGWSGNYPFDSQPSR